MNRPTPPMTMRSCRCAASAVIVVALIVFLAGCAGNATVERPVPRACVTELPGLASYAGEQCRTCENVHAAAPGEPRRCGLEGTQAGGDADSDGVPDRRDACPDTRDGAEVLANGCERIPLDGVNFDHDSAELSPSARRALERQLELLKGSDGVRVEITGHADSQGAREYNETLSRRRAQSVREFFIERGIAATRLAINGYGEAEPVADNDIAAGRKRNRRVEIRVVGRDTSATR